VHITGFKAVILDNNGQIKDEYKDKISKLDWDLTVSAKESNLATRLRNRILHINNLLT
jgi:hypothetical protein